MTKQHTLFPPVSRFQVSLLIITFQAAFFASLWGRIVGAFQSVFPLDVL